MPSTLARSRAGRSSPRVVRRVAVAAAIVGYSALAAVCRPLTAPALVAVLVPGVALVAVGVVRRPRPARPVGRRSVAVWAGLAAVGGVIELAMFLGPDDAAHPTLSTLADPVLDTYPGRFVGYALWLAAGVWLARR